MSAETRKNELRVRLGRWQHSVWMLVLLCGAWCVPARAQLVSFSSPLRAPVFMNPAMVGSSDYLRLMFIARSQWLNVKSPYNTVGASYDMHFGPYGNHALGVSFLNDIQGPGTMQVMESYVAYSYALDVTFDFRMRFGVQVGAIMKSTNYRGLEFPDQVTQRLERGVDSRSLALFPGNFKVVPDFAIGVQGEVVGWDFGVAVHHVAEPIFGVKREQWNVAYRKVTAHVSKAFNVFQKYRFKEPLYITPILVFTQQQKDLRLSVGCAVDYRWITASLWVRESLLYENHAAAFSVGYVGKHFEMGYTYDIGFLPGGFQGLNASVHEVYLSLKFPYPRRSALGSSYGGKKRSFFGSSRGGKKAYKSRSARR